jgi:hypothetical protein
MLAYKDMTFCTFYKDCTQAKACRRPLTPEVQAQAEKWWRGNGIELGPECTPTEAPIAVFVTPPPCHVKKTFRESVKEFAEKNDHLPDEIKEMSGVPSAIKKIK